jgi:D-cysteine desulfhydrase
VLLGLFDQPVTAHVRKNLLLFHANGAEIRYVGSLINAIFRYYVIERFRRPGSYFIPPGGSSALGTLGYVDAGLELAMQVEQKVLPLPRMIFLAAGTCSTTAGLILGLRLAGLTPRVIGVQVAPRPFANPKTVLRLACKALRKLKRHDQSVPQVKLGLSDAPIERGHYGPGYGVPTDAGRAAIQFMAENEGIPLEPTYTGKAFGALLDSVKSGSSRGPVLFWNTFNSVDLSSTADNVRFHVLPQEFHRFFQDDVVE